MARSKNIETDQVTEETTPAHEARKRAAENYKKDKETEVIETWYEWKLGKTYDEKKGKKLVQRQRTVNGVTETFVGWEMKVPVDFMKKIKDQIKVSSKTGG